MKNKFFAVSVVASLGLFNIAAHAATTTVSGGTVHFTGEFVNAACAVTTDSADQTVTLGQYRTAAITAAAQTTTNMPFNIKLTGCDNSIATTAAIAFNGTLDSTDPTLLAVNGGGTNTTAATGVGIQILDSASNVLTPNGTTYSVAKTLENGVNTIPFSARYKSTAATVSAGQADSDATFVVQYQ